VFHDAISCREVAPLTDEHAETTWERCSTQGLNPLELNNNLARAAEFSDNLRDKMISGVVNAALGEEDRDTTDKSTRFIYVKVTTSTPPPHFIRTISTRRYQLCRSTELQRINLRRATAREGRRLAWLSARLAGYPISGMPPAVRQELSGASQVGVPTHPPPALGVVAGRGLYTASSKCHCGGISPATGAN
jgi:hypothetical protein